MVRFRLILPALTIASPSGDAAAQWPPQVEPGHRVRVTVPEAQFQRGAERGHVLRGTIARLESDTLFLRITDSLPPLAIPRTWIRRLDVSRGVPSRVASAARGGLIWGAVGALEFLALAGLDDSNSLSAGQAALVGGAVGMAFGATFGALRPTERWRRVRLAPHLDGSGATALSLSFRVPL